ncbi:MAG: FAD/NAD(P)-binding protein [Chloroflexi bacterium]|uniref:FAD/NAD(P)-binding protein n=1 Tax=Candidatus Chlorohelix allophototropha TaxID=3003348 RepID=A0A8T7LW22_9CHLR|nr:FAD/NAD(P)-binding protein [Chloroflexota bacterium]WJW66265.1 FAD/NAD(P)-binding protein [Chloroflexota bacterium L227-S17]
MTNPSIISSALPNPMLPAPFVVEQVRKETNDTFTLLLEPVNEHREFRFQPGQFNMLYMFGVGEVPISISGDPAHPETLVHTLRAVGSVTNAMRMLKPGDTIGVRGPFGVPWPVDKAIGKDIVLITGGIGLAPLRPAIYHILTNRPNYGKFVLLYGARTPQEVLYKSELAKWRSRFDMTVEVTTDRATGSWMGDVGVVTTLIPRVPFDPHNALALVCGPEIMMRYTIMELEKRGVPLDHIYVSMERNMQCAIGLCGHCQVGPVFVCKDGPVFRFDQIQDWFKKWEV